MQKKAWEEREREKEREASPIDDMKLTRIVITSFFWTFHSPHHHLHHVMSMMRVISFFQQSSHIKCVKVFSHPLIIIQKIISLICIRWSVNNQSRDRRSSSDVKNFDIRMIRMMESQLNAAEGVERTIIHDVYSGSAWRYMSYIRRSGQWKRRRTRRMIDWKERRQKQRRDTDDNDSLEFSRMDMLHRMTGEECRLNF